jgi:hypothetical protein
MEDTEILEDDVQDEDVQDDVQEDFVLEHEAKIIFNDGTELEVLVNATTFIVDDRDSVPEYAENVTVPDMDGEGTRTIRHAKLQECYSPDDRFYFYYEEISEDSIWKRQIRSDIDYIAMMSDVELEG